MVVKHAPEDYSLADLQKFWEKNSLQDIKPNIGVEYPEGFDPRVVLQKIYQWSGAQSVVDLGCGYGRLCTAFPAAEYTGYDLNVHAVDNACSQHPEYRFSVINDACSFET